MAAPIYQHSLSTPFGELIVVWREEHEPAGPTHAILRRIYLPRDGVSPLPLVEQEQPQAAHGDHPDIADLLSSLSRLLCGEAANLDLHLADLSICPDFQRRVLRAEYGVPRRHVTTYGRLAAHLGAPRAARAVGSALAHNPFPLLIPCHRALRADLSLGGFQGGLAMKQALLEMEGLHLIRGRVADGEERVWY